MIKEKRKIITRTDGEYEILKYNAIGYFRHGKIYHDFRSLWNWYKNEKDKYEIEFEERGLLKKLQENLKEKIKI